MMVDGNVYPARPIQRHVAEGHKLYGTVGTVNSAADAIERQKSAKYSCLRLHWASGHWLDYLSCDHPVLFFIRLPL